MSITFDELVKPYTDAAEKYGLPMSMHLQLFATDNEVKWGKLTGVFAAGDHNTSLAADRIFQVLETVKEHYDAAKSTRPDQIYTLQQKYGFVPDMANLVGDNKSRSLVLNKRPGFDMVKLRVSDNTVIPQEILKSGRLTAASSEFIDISDAYIKLYCTYVGVSEVVAVIDLQTGIVTTEGNPTLTFTIPRK